MIFLLLLLLLLLLVHPSVCSSEQHGSHSVHFVTSSLLGKGDIKDLRDANFLLKTRLMFGSDEGVQQRRGGVSSSYASCTWVVFLPSFTVHNHRLGESFSRVEETFVMSSIQQARHIASEANCSILFSYENSFTTADEMVWLALRLAQKHVMKEQHHDVESVSHFLFMLPQAIFISSPLNIFRSQTFDTRDLIFMHLPDNPFFTSCCLNIFLIPVRALAEAAETSHLAKGSMCTVMEHMTSSPWNYQQVDVPVFYRFPLEADATNGFNSVEKSHFRREQSRHEAHKHQMPAVLLTVAGHNVDWYLFNTSFGMRGKLQFLYNLSDVSLDCEMQLSIPSYHAKWGVPIGSSWHSQDRETTAESIVNYTQISLFLNPSPSLCRAIFGSLLPDSFKARRVLDIPHNIEVGKDVLRSFDALPDWVISPVDFDQISPSYNAADFKWDGKPLPKSKSEAYDEFLSTTKPVTVYENPVTVNSPSDCSIQIVAYGDSHLCDAYENTIRLHRYSAYPRDHRTQRPGQFSSDICLAKPLVYLYTYNSSQVLNAPSLYRPNSFLQRCGNISIEEFLSAFDVVLDLCTTSLCQSYFPSESQLFTALKSSSQRASYHTTPTLWWQLFVLLQHPPTRYVMYLNADGAPCSHGYDVKTFRLMEEYNMIMLNVGEYGDSGGSAKYPYPSYYLSKLYLATQERFWPFSVMDMGNKNIQRLLYEATTIFNATMYQMLLGRTFVRGNQNCFRQAMYYMRGRLSDYMPPPDSPYFCARSFRFKEGCWLYLGADAAEKC